MPPARVLRATPVACAAKGAAEVLGMPFGGTDCSLLDGAFILTGKWDTMKLFIKCDSGVPPGGSAGCVEKAFLPTL